MKITVLGCGALGQVWLSALDNKGHAVQGWLRVPQPYCAVNVMDTRGVISNKIFTANDPVFLTETELLLVTLKAWQVSEAITNLQPLLPADCPILLLHNGMGIVDELHDLKQPIIMGITTHAAKRDGNIIRHVAQGITRIGPGSPDCHHLNFLADTLHEALPDVAWHNIITPAQWEKLAVNCAINPLSVIHNCTNGELLAHQDEIAGICNEIAMVMLHEGLHTSAASLLNYVLNVIHSTAENTSSMLQDMRARQRTEIDYITGYVLRRARRLGLSVPENNRIFTLIKQKEQYYEQKQPGTGLPGAWFRRD